MADEFPELLAGAFEELAERSPAGPPPTAETVAVDLTIGLNSLRLYVAAQEDAMPESDTLALLLDLELPVSVSLGKVQMLFGEVLKLASGSIVELNRSVDDPVDIVVNEQVIASGEVVVVNGNYGVRIQSLASRAARMRSAGVTVGAF